MVEQACSARSGHGLPAINLSARAQGRTGVIGQRAIPAVPIRPGGCATQGRNERPAEPRLDRSHKKFNVDRTRKITIP